MHEDIIQRCIREAGKADLNHRHGAMIVRQGCTVVLGHNYMQSARLYKSVHAEVNAIEEFKKRYPKSWLRTSVLIVVRANRQGQLRNSAPCVSCQKYIQKHEIPITYYSTTTDGDGAV